MRPSIRDTCGRSRPRSVGVTFAGALAGALAVAVAVAGAAAAGPLGLTITSGPTGTVASSTATFTFQAHAVSFQCSLDGGASTDCSNRTITYANLANGRHVFMVVASSSNTSPKPITDVQSQAWTVAIPPDTAITNRPPASTTSSVAVLTFDSIPAGATFECRLDGSAFTACTSPDRISGIGPGAHTFDVRAVNGIATDPTPATASWTVVPLDTRITSSPRRSTTSTSASIGFVSVPAGAGFDCALDGGAFVSCAPPARYTHLGLGRHTFRVRARTPDGTDSSPAEVSWSILVATPDTTITTHPAANVRGSTALLAFRSIPPGAGFECSLDHGPFKPCASPTRLTKLVHGKHVFLVRARNSSGVDASPAAARWRIGGSAHRWLAPAAGGAGGGLLVGFVGFGLALRRRLRLRLRLQAREEEPHGRCQGRAWQCQKELTLKPGPRRIAHLNATTVDASGERQSDRIAGQLVSDLNDAVDKYRHARDAMQEVRLALLPIADTLLARFDAWLAGDPAVSHEIALEAHLVGGKAECVFTPWRCHDGSWRKHRPWKVELEDERDEQLAIVLHPRTTVASLVGHLSIFVTRVDVPHHVPEAVPLPHA